MKKILFVFMMLFLKLSITYSQNIELVNGYEYYYTKVAYGDKSIARSQIDNVNYYPKLRFSVTPFKNKKVSVISSYHTIFSHVNLNLGNDEELKNDLFVKASFANTRVHRIGIGVGYKFKFWKERIIINPRIIFNNEWAVETWNSIPRSDSRGRYSFTGSNHSHPGFQILPEFNIPLFFKLYKNLYLQVDYAFLWGRRSITSLNVDYTINGSPQPQAKFYTDGTAHHAMLGFSYFFY